MNHQLRTNLLSILLIAALGAMAQGPNGSGTYYRNAGGKSGAALKTALHNIIGNPSVTSYSGLYEAYKKTDMRADGKVRDWYSNITSYDWDTHGNQKEGAGWNREHSVPQSWFEGSTGTPKSDVVHVVPTDSWVNNMRSNYPLAEVGNVEKQSAGGYSKLGTCKTAGYSGKVFEPNDEIKGDMARIYFYMVTCYEDKAVEWGHAVFSTQKYPGLQQWYLDMLMRWSKQDPVDAREIARNNAVYGVQQNRNPFVDYPGLEDYVWGTKNSEPFSYDNYQGGSGEGPVVIAVAQPVFSPDGGTFIDKVEVAMTTTTEGATIYYTTNGAEVSEQSNRYTQPIVLTTTTTLKAIAVKDGTKSYQTVANYVISQQGQGGEQPVDGMIAFGNQLFGTSYGGSINKSDNADLVGSQNGVTVVYSLGEGGANRYCNDEQIRLYQKNKLTISVESGLLTALEFQLAKTTSKTLQASTGTVSDLKWTGSAQQVVFNVDEGSGNMQLSGVKVSVSGITGIDDTVPTNSGNGGAKGKVYDLQGREVRAQRGNPVGTSQLSTLNSQRGNPVGTSHLSPLNTHLKKGLYISNGKKILVR